MDGVADPLPDPDHRVAVPGNPRGAGRRLWAVARGAIVARVKQSAPPARPATALRRNRDGGVRCAVMADTVEA